MTFSETLKFTIFFLLCVAIGIRSLIDLTIVLSDSKTNAVILETYPSDHSTCLFKYNIKGKEYTHLGFECGNKLVGETIAVNYSLLNPNSSTSVNPLDDFGFNFFIFCIFLIFTILYGKSLGVINRLNIKELSLKTVAAIIGAIMSFLWFVF
ncbi:MAG: hypothetical protein ACXVCP_16130 [Bdellovibrio sp.]